MFNLNELFETSAYDGYYIGKLLQKNNDQILISQIILGNYEIVSEATGFQVAEDFSGNSVILSTLAKLLPTGQSFYVNAKSYDEIPYLYKYENDSTSENGYFHYTKSPGGPGTCLAFTNSSVTAPAPFSKGICRPLCSEQVLTFLLQECRVTPVFLRCVTDTSVSMRPSAWRPLTRTALSGRVQRVPIIKRNINCVKRRTKELN